MTLEITESVLIHDTDQALQSLVELRNIGVQIALDDFGTGYSSLSYLSHFDRSFVTGLASNTVDTAIVRAVVQLAHDTWMTVIAEGIETSEQHQLVTDLGCDYCQATTSPGQLLQAQRVETRTDGPRSTCNFRKPSRILVLTVARLTPMWSEICCVVIPE